jgi:hypothetical protein
MQGLITERHFESAERWFPGIRRFYLALVHKPSTFLELVWEYEKAVGRYSVKAAEQSCQVAGRPGR